MKNEKKKRKRTLTKKFELGKGRKLEEVKDFGEKERFRSREKREVLRCLSEK